jgi:hypothetical protein
MNMVRGLAIMVLVLGVVAIVLGGVFIGQGIIKNKLIVDRMKVEKVTLAINPDNPQELTPIRNAADAQKAADKIASDRRAIAPTYQDLLGGGHFDPTNPKQLVYAQAMNLENYLYMAVTAFGLVQVVTASGVFMVITGLALGGTGLALNRLGRRLSQV